MRIRDGRFTYTGREQIQKAMDGKDLKIQELRTRLEIVGEYAKRSLDLHVPYVSGHIDVSCSEHDTLADDLCEQVKRNVWCSECQKPWPCKKIEELRQLRSFVHDAMDRQDEDDFKTRIRNMEPRQKKGQLDIYV